MAKKCCTRAIPARRQSAGVDGGGCGTRRRPGFAPLVWVCLVGFALWTAAPLRAQQMRSSVTAEARWEELKGCRLLANSVVDGDSFHVLHEGREYIFRLYFVDAPETDAALRDRVVDQAAYFGIAVNDVPPAGGLAAAFTRALLQATSFTVHTRWQNAMGRSSLARYYAIVFVDGKNLAEELVANGLARIYGLRANWPDGPRSVTFINQLKNRELTAREKQLGVWNAARFARRTTATATNEPPAKPTLTNAANSKVDLNTATAAELQKLSGIGPVLAGRIIAHRPYGSVEELDRVPGVGPKLMERLKPLVEAGQSSNPQ